MWPYLAAGGVGGLVGAIELASRYRDRPSALLGLSSAWIYVIANAAASAFALLLAHTFGWSFGLRANPGGLVITQVIGASFGAMIVFRSAFATVRVGDQEAAIGPSFFLATLLAIADRAVDRSRGDGRSRDVARIMKDVSFEKARIALPAYCLALLQNISAEEQQDLTVAVDSLTGTKMSDGLKSLNLGLLLMNVAGPTLLAGAVDALRSEIKPAAD